MCYKPLERKVYTLLVEWLPALSIAIKNIPTDSPCRGVNLHKKCGHLFTILMFNFFTPVQSKPLHIFSGSHTNQIYIYPFDFCANQTFIYLYDPCMNQTFIYILILVQNSPIPNFSGSHAN